MANASVLSVAYLVVATVIEAARKWLNYRWTETAAVRLDAVPAVTLDWFGLYAPLRQAVIEGSLPTWAMRLLLGAVGVGSIFLVAIGVGIFMWLARWVLGRISARRPSHGP